MPEGRRFLLAPAGGGGDGMGHLRRCMDLARELPGPACIYTGYMDPPAARAAREEARGARVGVRDALAPSERFDFVIVDTRSCTLKDIEVLSRRGVLICLDGSGSVRARADYLIDLLPRLPDGVPPNAASPGFLNLPGMGKKRHAWPPKRILVSFGGEDKARLTDGFITQAVSRGILAPRALTVVHGPLFGERRWPKGVRVLTGVSSLRRIIPGYDLVITHFGLTALEAMASGVPVILLNPSRYHERLASLLGIPTMGIGSPDPRKLFALLKDPRRARDAAARFRRARKEGDRESLAGHISRLDAPRGSSCPACGARGNPVIARFPLRTYRRCSCGVVHLQSFTHPLTYGRAYFEEEYARQYGRTYLQDFDSITESGRERLEVIKKILGSARGALVDAGCAYGPFLAAAREAGFSPFGIDVSGEAVRHVKALGIPAVKADFITTTRRALPRGPISVLTFWYVIEHMEDLDGCLRKAASFLAPGGILAFSTPNLSGVSGRKNLTEFLRTSPADHYSVLSPRALRRLLSRHGLRLARVRVTGHHPERFPSLLGKAALRHSSARAVLGAASRILGLGDTFEAYAVKEGRS